MAWLDILLGLSARAEDLTSPQMVVRAIVMFVALLVIVRLGKKRFLGRATAFDFIITITAGSIAGRAITGGTPFFGAMAAVAALIAVHWVFSYLARDSKTFSSIIKGSPTRLIKDGVVDRGALRAAHMSDDDLDEDLRQQGLRSSSGVAEARLERSGKLSVITKA